MEKVLDGVADRFEQIGDDGTIDEGHQDVRQGRQRSSKALKAVNQEEKDDAEADRPKPCEHPVDVRFDVRLFVHHVLDSISAADSRRSCGTC